MRKQEIGFNSFYQTKLQGNLAMLNKKKLPALLATVYIRLSMVLVFIMFFSVFLGFVSIFPMEGIFVWVVRGFMIFTAFLVLFGNIRKYVQEDLRKLFPEFAKSRANIVVITAASCVLMMVGATYLGIYYLGSEGMGFNLIFRFGGAIFAIVAIALPSMFLSKVSGRFSLEYKKLLIPQLLGYLGSEASYLPNQVFPQQGFIDSGLFKPEDIRKYTGSDLVEGKVGQTAFQFSMLEVQDRREKNTNKGKEIEIVEIFKGLFYSAGFNKPLAGNTLVLPDVARELFGEQVGEKLNRIGNLVYQGVKFEQLENREFEKYFTVYSSDPVEARYVLSPKMLERMVELRKELDMDYSVSFKGDKMYLAIETPKDLFGPNMFASTDNLERAEAVEQFLSKILNITEKFDLNTRIWAA